MSENNLFQFAQVIAELPIQNTAPNNNNSQQHQQPDNTIHNYNSRYLHIRKNACVVCSVCFTCSKYYGVDCTCQEIQPRRGKNLPEGGLDSRAKKLHREDRDDFEFSIKWINENAHNMYKDENDTVLGLRDLSEVSLCKAHSSTLYRAKKRHERSKELRPIPPPSPADSVCNTTNTNDHHFHNPYPLNHSSVASGGLAAKVREISSNQHYQQQQHHQQHHQQHQPQVLRMHEVPDFSRMSHSTSVKRKRTYNKSSHKSPKIDQSQQHQLQQQRPNSSVSTPLYSSSSNSSRMNNPFMQQQQQQHPFSSTSTNNLSMSQQQEYIQQQVQHQQQQQQQVQHQQQQQQQVQIVDNFPSQLPPLHSRGHSISSSLLPSQQPVQQQQIYHTNNTSSPRPNNKLHQQAQAPSPQPEPSSSTSTMDTSPSNNHIIPMVIETVSLRPSTSSSTNDFMYYFRNLAITDNFTFRDLLAEIDMTGSPPPGKRIVISDSEKFYPLDQAIRSVIRRPNSTHLDLCLGLTDKPSINWSTYKN